MISVQTEIGLVCQFALRSQALVPHPSGVFVRANPIRGTVAYMSGGIEFTQRSQFGAYRSVDTGSAIATGKNKPNGRGSHFTLRTQPH